MHCLREWEPDQLVYIDESVANERTLDRKWGWAPKGRAARIICPLTRIKKWSILPLYTMDGFIAYEIIHGSFMSELFEAEVGSEVRNSIEYRIESNIESVWRKIRHIRSYRIRIGFRFTNSESVSRWWIRYSIRFDSMNSVSVTVKDMFNRRNDRYDVLSINVT